MSDQQPIQLLDAGDDRDILGYFRAIIRDPKYQLHLVENGAQALQVCGKQKIDLAFIDVNMPGMDGIETLVKWKAAQPATQIVIISSYSDGNLVREAIQKGAYTYLFKPLNKRDVFAVMLKSLKEAGIDPEVALNG